MALDRHIAVVAAIGCAYGAVFAITTHHLLALGPCAAGFVVALFAAQLLQSYESFEGDSDGVDVCEGHGAHLFPPQ